MNATNSNVEILRIRELNLDMIAPTTATYKKFEQGGSKLAIVGAPGRGKSSVIGSILYAKKHIFPVAMIVSTVEKDSPYFSKFIPNIFIHDKYDEKQLEKFIQRQKLSKEHLECPWAFVVLDDCTDDPSIFRKPVALMEYLIKTYTNEGDLVLDNCAGSGTTAVASAASNSGARAWD
jgi:hypothetical protein